MSERNRGMVIPFAISASRIRRGAYEHRKRGRVVEAVELLRQAAVREDSAQGWLALARQLGDMGCHEQALRVLYPLLGRDTYPDDVWMELARNQAALGMKEAAIDSLYHSLQVDPYSDASDDARYMLDELEELDAPREASRVSALARRAVASWREGRFDESIRRFHRGMRICCHPAQLRVTLALLMMMEDRFDEALREVLRARREDPTDSRAATVLCVVLDSMGRRRVAHGLLAQAAKLCDSPAQEDRMITTAWALSADDVLASYLAERLKHTPYRATLLEAQAELCWRQGRQAQAEALWHRVLRLDAENVRAMTLLKWAPEHPEEELPPDEMLPREELRLRMLRLAKLVVSDAPMAELLRPGSESRSLLDWSFTLADEKLQTTVLGVLTRNEDAEAQRYLRCLLTVPTVLPSIRQQVLLTLADRGETGPLNLMMGTHITTARCTAGEQVGRGPWKIFLGLLLGETRRWHQAMPMAFFAADVWRHLTREQRAQAVGESGYAWVKAMELLYLRKTGQDEAAGRVVRELPVSVRRISRVLRIMARQLMPPEGDS